MQLSTAPPGRHYHGTHVLARMRDLVQSHYIRSTGVDLYMDVYAQKRVDAPVLVFNHGGGGHSGLFVPLALSFHDRGYTVVVPDQRAQGRSGGEFGDFTIAEAVQNIVDVSRWARKRFTGPLYIGGSSIGGGLAYAAAAALAEAGQTPRAIVCINLYDFGDPRTAIAFTSLAFMARLPKVPALISQCSRVLSRLMPRMRLPYRPMSNFRAMVDKQDQVNGFYAAWCSDPLTLRSVTLRYLSSMLETPPAISFEQNALIPVLVINPMQDRMVKPALTRASFERLGGPCAYAEIDYGHFSLQDGFTNEVVTLSHQWFLRPTPAIEQACFNS